VTFGDLCIDDTAATAAPAQIIATVTGVASAPAQTLSLNGQPVGSDDGPAMLFENVVQAWGNLSKPLGPEDVLQDTMGSKLVKYFFVPTNATALDNYTFAVNTEDLELQEGYYALSAKVSWLPGAVTAWHAVCQLAEPGACSMQPCCMQHPQRRTVTVLRQLQTCAVSNLRGR
jgi:hypothetical protein